MTALVKKLLKIGDSYYVGLPIHKIREKNLEYVKNATVHLHELKNGFFVELIPQLTGKAKNNYLEQKNRMIAEVLVLLDKYPQLRELINV